MRAAEELGVVRGAVRLQIAVLENHFGEKLFRREGRKLVPTAKAQAFAEAATAALALLQHAAAELRTDGEGRLRLGVPSAFGIWWLMPRIADLQNALGNAGIDIVPMSVVESLAVRPEFDAVIMGGEYRPSPGITAVRFMDDEFGPVASPQVAAALGADPQNMTRATCLTSRSVPKLWEEWFAESRTPPVTFERVHEFEDLLLALGAARSGLGVALAPRASIEDDLARNILVAPFGFTSRPAGYSFCCRTSDAGKKHFAALRDWLVSAGQGDR
jgi:LysR family transcriptional regulator, glycine cleavage system transcriptional activator